MSVGEPGRGTDLQNTPPWPSLRNIEMPWPGNYPFCYQVICSAICRAPCRVLSNLVDLPSGAGYYSGVDLAGGPSGTRKDGPAKQEIGSRLSPAPAIRWSGFK